MDAMEHTRHVEESGLEFLVRKLTGRDTVTFSLEREDDWVEKKATVIQSYNYPNEARVKVMTDDGKEFIIDDDGIAHVDEGGSGYVGVGLVKDLEKTGKNY